MYLLDCTLRDGGYYNAWDFSSELINQYLDAMQAPRIDIVELGPRTLKNQGFQGPCAFTTDMDPLLEPAAQHTLPVVTVKLLGMELGTIWRRKI